MEGWEGRTRGGSQLARQKDREVVSLYQEHAALAGSSLSVVVPLIQSAATSASEAPDWAKAPLVPFLWNIARLQDPSVTFNLQATIVLFPALNSPSSHQTVGVTLILTPLRPLA